MGWLARFLLLLAGLVAGWFVPRDDVGFSFIQFVVLLIIIFVVAMAALYFPKVRDYFKGKPPEDTNI